MKKIIIIPIVILNILTLKVWYFCTSFNYVYHFSFSDVQLQINDLTPPDSGSIFITRLFHNKLIQSVLDLYKRYTYFLDLNLLVSLLSFAGLVGFVLGVWYFLSSKKKKHLIVLFALALLMPMVEVLLNLNLNFPVKLLLVGLPLELISIYGHFRFIQENRKSVLLWGFYVIIFIISMLLILSYPHSAYNYCSK